MDAKCRFSPFLGIDPHLGAIVDDELHRSRLREDLHKGQVAVLTVLF